MKEYIKNYLKVINESSEISSKYIDKKFFQTIDHFDIFLTNAFLNSFSSNYSEINLMVNKFLDSFNVKNLHEEKEFLAYDQNTKTVCLIYVYPKGSARHDIILISSFKSETYPKLQKNGQLRVLMK